MGEVAAGAAAGGAIGSVVPGVGTAIGAGIGALGGGIADWIGQSNANNQNWDEFVSNQSFNQWALTSARDYNTQMSNTSYQRGMADMRAAGLNPMLAFQQGGASSPTSPTANPGTGAPMQNEMSGLGKSISSAVPSALAARQTMSDIGNIDKDTLLKDSQSLNQIAQADQATTSSHLNEENTMAATIANKRNASTMSSDIDTKKIQNEADQNKARLDIKNQARERLLNQIGQGAGIISSAAGAYSDFANPSINLKNANTNEGNMLNKWGSKGLPVKR